MIWRRKESKEEHIEEYSWWVTDCGSLNGTFINCTKVKEERLHDGDTLTLGGGAGLEEGERSDCLASDLVFRFESPDNIMPLVTSKASDGAGVDKNSNANSGNPLAPRDPNVQRVRTADRPKTAAVSSLNGSSRRRRLEGPEGKDADPRKTQWPKVQMAGQE